MAARLARLLKPVMGRGLDRLDTMEDSIEARPGSLGPDHDSPRRFNIPRESLEQGHGLPASGSQLPVMAAAIAGIIQSIRTLDKDPAQPKTEIGPGELAELEAFLKDLGVCSIGYARVPARWVFQDKAILYANALVAAMEMDKGRIDTAPSPAAGLAAFHAYRDLGRTMNKGADYLRERGYGAHAGHPLGGMVLYPPLAQMAGIGWLGAHGLIITPEYGPRVRLAALFTSIENLPFSEDNPHGWLDDYCEQCQVCVAQCPTGAIRAEPERHENGQVTCVINERCFPYFLDEHACSVCIKACPFNNVSYEGIKARFMSQV